MCTAIEHEMTNFTAAMLLLRELIATAQFLAEVPTNEQGYPDDTVCDYAFIRLILAVRLIIN